VFLLSKEAIEKERYGFEELAKYQLSEEVLDTFYPLEDATTKPAKVVRQKI